MTVTGLDVALAFLLVSIVVCALAHEFSKPRKD